MDSALERFNQVVERIQSAAQRSGQNPQKIALVAVSKFVSFDRISPFVHAGVKCFGENRVQEALAKWDTDASRSLRSQAEVHLIGHLQSNKARKAAGFFDMVQSLDSVALAETLNRCAGEAKRRLACLVQIKISEEQTKEGLPAAELDEFLGRSSEWPNLSIRGLMGVAPQTPTPEETRPAFRTLRKLFEMTKLQILSMGMSGDYEVAIEEGSTMVRIGTALFGPRPVAGSAL